MKYHPQFVAVTVVLTSLVAWSPGAARAELGSEEVSVPVERGEGFAAQGERSEYAAGDEFEVAVRRNSGSRVEIGLSSWAPSALSAETRLSDATDFRGAGVPQVTLQFATAPLLRWRALSLSGVAGVSFSLLKRTGTYPGVASSPAYGVSENLFLFPVRLGLESRVAFYGPWSAYVSASLLPTIGFTTRTVMDDGQTILGLPVGASAGIAHDFGWLGGRFSGIQLKAGVDATYGRWSRRTDLTGLGAQAGVSVPL